MRINLSNATRRLTRPGLLLLPLLLAGCERAVLNPAGDVARQQRDLIFISTGLMLLIIIPVMVLTVVFAWRYRASNEDAEYRPDWDHSTSLELVIWSAPLLIIIALGAVTWLATHTLDPYRPVDRMKAGEPVPANVRPLEVQVVSLDWKWLFIYPEQGIAMVNRLVLPTDRPIRFRLTSSSVMNTFYVPTLAGMIYTMPGMETELNAVLERTGRFEGMSANYSGAGFSYMNFPMISVDRAGFDRFVAESQASARRLDRGEYIQLEKPSERVPAILYGTVERGLFSRVAQVCVHPGQTCMSETMRHDSMEPGSHAPVNNAPYRPADRKGALEKSPEEKGSSPNRSAPRGPAAGTGKPGDPSNRNMTHLDLPALPGAAAAAAQA
ncbi:ubiquinol oxidase subunit II [uncultured Sphingomonas sp.]|uniref:ubiquinol oxidase subunit II n=1 Tax=uncultured Sphingomonas sp. TaxID=158754 RepID=UPI0025D0A6C0|nr:ubiquinol oxidase subunit II [uncultured Sphingomonas sp.]